MLLTFALILACLGGGGWLFINSARFGAMPEGARLERIQRSPHYARGEFRNVLPTPILLEEKGVIASWAGFLFSSKENSTPPGPVPAVRTVLDKLARTEDVVIWLGHSSIFLQLGGLRILIDPVLSDHAAPVSFSTRAFPGSGPYSAEDLPDIDVLLLSHDHWDHLDDATLRALRPRIGRVICGLGMGAHLRRWGFEEERIFEGDWGDKLTVGDVSFHITTARHYSGRSLTRNKTLWAGFALESPERKMFFSGDSGYGPHFAELGAQFGPFDLVFLDCGQYNESWKLIHMMPEETAQAADDLRARALLPIHAGRFSIAYHAWDEPYQRISAASRGKAWRLVTPRIGEPVRPGSGRTPSSPWWLTVGKAR